MIYVMGRNGKGRFARFLSHIHPRFLTPTHAVIIVFYAIRMKQRRTPKEIFTNIVLPFIGMCLTGILWLNLHFDALLYGAIWLTIGIIVLIYMTRGLREPLTMKIEEQTLAEEGTPVPHVKHGAV
jgi:putrescine importer